MATLVKNTSIVQLKTVITFSLKPYVYTRAWVKWAGQTHWSRAACRTTFPPSRATDDGFGTIKMKANKMSLLTTQSGIQRQNPSSGPLQIIYRRWSSSLSIRWWRHRENVQNIPLPSIYMLLKLYHKQNMSKTLRSH